MSLLNDFRWRYATKRYDSSLKVDKYFIDEIVDAIWLAPTSSGLQPFKLLVITNQELKDKIMHISFNQVLVSQCSHLLVFAAWDNYTEERIDGIYKYITQERGQDPDAYKTYTDMLKGIYLNRPAKENFEHAARQTYVALGFAMAMAAEHKIDSTPLEGFDNKALDDLLDLQKQGLNSVSMLALGYRDEANDWLVNLAKVRHPKNEFLIEIK